MNDRGRNLEPFLLLGGFCNGLGKLIPRIAPVFKFVGAAYILYLAWKTWKRTPVTISDSTVEKPLTFYNGFLLQFLNVKAIMLGLASYPRYFLPAGGGFFLVVLFSDYHDTLLWNRKSDLGNHWKYVVSGISSPV